MFASLPGRDLVVRSLAVAILAAGVVVAPSAHASSPPGHGAKPATRKSNHSLLATGRGLFEDQRYEDSIQTLSAALMRPNLKRKERIEVYRFLAYNYITLGRLDEADAAVRGLFSLDPDFALGKNESPRFRVFFEKVSKKWNAEGRPGLVKKSQHKVPVRVLLRHASPARWERGKPLSVTGSVVRGGAHVSKIVVHYRVAGTKGFRKASATLKSRRFSTVIPGNAIKPPMLEYYIEAVGENGLPVASRGDIAAPLRISVPREEKSGGLLASPWFWITAAVVAAGGATATYVLTRDDGAPQGDPGPEPNGPPMSRVIVTVGE